MGAVTKAPPVLARVYRGPHVESAHRGSWPWSTTGAGSLRCGDAGAPVYARSAAKPFQAMPLLLAGGEKRFRPRRRRDRADVRVARRRAAARALARDLLQRGRLPRRGPGVRRACADARGLGAGAGPAPAKSRRPLHNNCSGKHAGTAARVPSARSADRPDTRTRPIRSSGGSVRSSRATRTCRSRRSASPWTAATCRSFACRCRRSRRLTRG